MLALSVWPLIPTHLAYELSSWKQSSHTRTGLADDCVSLCWDEHAAQNTFLQ